MAKLLTFLGQVHWLNILGLILLVTAVIFSFWYPSQSLTVALAGIGIVLLGVLGK